MHNVGWRLDSWQLTSAPSTAGQPHSCRSPQGQRQRRSSSSRSRHSVRSAVRMLEDMLEWKSVASGERPGARARFVRSQCGERPVDAVQTPSWHLLATGLVTETPRRRHNRPVLAVPRRARTVLHLARASSAFASAPPVEISTDTPAPTRSPPQPQPHARSDPPPHSKPPTTSYPNQQISKCAPARARFVGLSFPSEWSLSGPRGSSVPPAAAVRRADRRSGPGARAEPARPGRGRSAG